MLTFLDPSLGQRSKKGSGTLSATKSLTPVTLSATKSLIKLNTYSPLFLDFSYRQNDKKRQTL
jgi:hypothetical protein